jgi:hypothetical protein
LPAGNYAYPLAAGARVEISARVTPTNPLTVTAVSLLVGTYYNTSTGHLNVTLCVDATCAQGLAAIGLGEDNKPLRIALNHPIRMEAGTEYTIRIEKLDGDKDVALWMFPLHSTNTAITIVGKPTAVRDKYLPDLRFSSPTEEKLVLRGRSMSIYELPNTRDYFSARACTLTPLSHEHVDASCADPSKLLRLELSVRGWSATVNGQPVPIDLSDGVFQTIDLPAGEARVEFTYQPPGFKLALAAAGAALLLVLAVFGSVIRSTRALHPRASVP